MYVTEEQISARENNLFLLNKQLDLMRDTLDKLGEFIGTERSDLLKETLEGLVKRSYQCGQDVIFDALEVALAEDKPLMECLMDNDPKYGIPVIG